MSDHQQLPQRPNRIPPHILRRRRIIAVLILLVILGLIGWGVWALFRWIFSDDDQPDQPQPMVTQSASPQPDAQAEVNDCDPQILTVTGSTDQPSYAPDELPVFTMVVTHDGDVLCDAALGSDQQSFVVQDAEGQFVFSTRACQVEPQAQVVEMEPGQSESVAFEWNRVGSDEDCQTVVEDLAAGQYQLLVSMGEREAEPVTFVLEAHAPEVDADAEK